MLDVNRERDNQLDGIFIVNTFAGRHNPTERGAMLAMVCVL